MEERDSGDRGQQDERVAQLEASRSGRDGRLAAEVHAARDQAQAERAAERRAAGGQHRGDDERRDRDPREGGMSVSRETGGEENASEQR